jgi:predicted transcriptional regulator
VRDALAVATHIAYNVAMEISFATDLEAKLRQVAARTGKGADEVVQELVATYLEHEEWFSQEVGKGLASLDDARSISHDAVRRQMEQILGS